MEDPGICTDAGDGGSPDENQPLSNHCPTLDANGEEISLHVSSKKQQVSSQPAKFKISTENNSESQSENCPLAIASDVELDDDLGACQGSLVESSVSASSLKSVFPEAQLSLSDNKDIAMSEVKPHDELCSSSGKSALGVSEMHYECVDNLKTEQVMEDDCVNNSRECGEEIQEQEEENLLSSDWSPVYEDGLQLDELPDDVIFYIASFLDARVIRCALSQVCQRFQAMFDNEVYWRTRIFLRCNKPYPAVPIPDFCWSEACLEREDSYRVWGNWKDNTHHFLYGHNVYGEVDSVHLMNEGHLLVTGDRNRFLNLVDLSKWEGAENTKMSDLLVHTDSSHKGWIWSMASVGDTLITGSWDGHVRLFDVTAGCEISDNFKCQSAVLSLYAEENEIVASCYREIAFIDRRTSQSKPRMFHSRPVLCVVGNDRYIVSGSEDKSLVIYDRKADKVLKKITLEAYPLCMSFLDNQLWYGDRQGNLHLLDGTDGAFNVVGTYDVCHKEKVTGVVCTKGAIFTCSGDKTVKVSEPTRNPRLITSIDVHTKEVARIAYKNGVVATAAGDECIGVWLPKYWGNKNSNHLV